MTNRMDTKKLVTMGLLIAISTVLLVVFRVPFPLAPFLEYTPADVPILIGTMLYGSGAGLVITILSSAIQALTVSASSGVYGFLMHVIATGAMVLILGFIYKKDRRSVKRLVWGLMLGSIVMTVAMVALNLVITPLFLGSRVKDVIGMVMPIIIPFNLIKAGVNSVLSFVIYKGFEKFLSNQSSL